MKKFEPDWLTIPQFACIKPETPYHKEQENCDHEEFPVKNLHVLARTDVEAEGDGQRYLLRISADDHYKLWINGTFAGQGPAPAWPEKYYYNEIDITPFFRPGKNVLAVHLYYQGLVNRVWNSGDGRFALAAQLVCGNTGEEVLPLMWRYKISEAYSGRTIGYETQFLEDFDSRRWDAGWNLADFDDSRWEPMEAAEWADYKLIKQHTEMLTVYRREPEVIKKEDGCWSVDIGREITGSLCINCLLYTSDAADE